MLLVDDHDLWRPACRGFCSRSRAVDIVGEAAGEFEAAAACARSRTGRRRHGPETMPGMTGVEATRHISRDAPPCDPGWIEIEEQDVMDAILASACGYLLKDASIQELMRELSGGGGRRIADLIPLIAGEVCSSTSVPTTPAPEAAATMRREVSDREIQVTKLISNGRGQRHDRRRAAHQPEDGQESHLEHPDEAPGSRPGSGGGVAVRSGIVRALAEGLLAELGQQGADVRELSLASPATVLRRRHLRRLRAMAERSG